MLNIFFMSGPFSPASAVNPASLHLCDFRAEVIFTACIQFLQWNPANLTWTQGSTSLWYLHCSQEGSQYWKISPRVAWRPRPSSAPGHSAWVKASLWLCIGPSQISVSGFQITPEASSLQEQDETGQSLSKICYVFISKICYFFKQLFYSQIDIITFMNIIWTIKIIWVWK